MLNNQYHGITVEDLEKAASVRLFEKAAAAEGLNLNEFSEAQVDDLYSNYQHSSEENTMNEEIFDLFEKQAAYEGVDLDALSDDELAYVFDNFVGNLETDYEDDYEDDDYYYVDEDGEEEAYEKLAEAEILGRHMARAYMDELEKEAEDYKAKSNKARQEAFNNPQKRIETGMYTRTLGERAKELLTGHEAAEQRALRSVSGGKGGKKYEGTTTAAQKRAKKARQLAHTEKLKKARRFERAKGYGKRVGVVGGLAAAGYGAKKMMEKEAANEAIYDLAFERAEEFLKEGSIADYDGSTIDNLAIEVLEDHGYYVD